MTIIIFYWLSPSCIMIKGCPSNKCYKKSECLSGNIRETGCSIRSQSCLYKDETLKEDYHEITAEQANECVLNFIKENQNKYEKLQYIDYSNKYIEEETSNISSIEDKRDFNKDKYFWFIQYGTKNKIPGYLITFSVGAQSCTVYPDDYLN